MKLTIEQKDDGWWVIDPSAHYLKEPCGPYNTKADATDDRQGLERFFNEAAFDSPED